MVQRISCWLAAAILCLYPLAGQSQAYCALRDPVTSIYDLFPEADGYRSIAKVVGNSARNSIRDQLEMDLHFNELGKHTVYVAVRAGEPLGIVHARSEADRWGLTEIVWALSLNLEVIDYRFQRSRNPQRSALAASSLPARIRGRDIGALKPLLASAPELPQYDRELLDLWSILVRSALKTIVVTESGWRTELANLRLERAEILAKSHFPQAKALIVLNEPYTPAILNELDGLQLRDQQSIPRNRLELFQILGPEREALGYLASGPWRSGDIALTLHWLVDNAGKIVNVSSPNRGVPEEVTPRLVGLRGLSKTMADQCASALEISALEISVLATGHGSTPLVR